MTRTLAATRRPGWPFRLNRKSPQARGLVRWWPMFRANLARDLARSDHGTLQGNATWQPAVNLGGMALTLDGTGDYVQTAFTPAGFSALTFSAWVNLTAAGFYPVILSYGTNADNTPELRFQDATGQPEIARRSDNAGALHGTSLTGTGWHLITGTADGTTLTLYVDGILSDQDAFAHGISSATTLRIGRRSNDEGGTFEMTGQLLDARIYNRVLLPAEVRGLFRPLTRWELYDLLDSSAFSAPSATPTPRLPVWLTYQNLLDVRLTSEERRTLGLTCADTLNLTLTDHSHAG